MDNIIFNKLTENNTNSPNPIIEPVITSINTTIQNIKSTLNTNNKSEYHDVENITKNKFSEQIKKIYKLQLKENKKNIYKSNLALQKYIKIKLATLENNKCLSKIPYMIEDLINNSENFIKEGFKKISSAFKYGTKILKSLFSFASNTLYKGGQILNNLLFGIPEKIWEGAKYIFNTIASAFSWVIKIGKIALEYIWLGVSTIFNFGISTLSTIAEYAYKGTKWFLIHWFKMMINTLVNPALWIINIPLMIIITTAALAAFSALVSGGILVSSMLVSVFSTIAEITVVIGNWIWDGISFVAAWIKKTYKDSWLETNIINPFIKFIDDNIPESIKILYEKVVNWFDVTTGWVESNFLPIKNSISDIITNITNEFKQHTGQTYFQTIINTLTSSAWFPGTLKRKIYSSLGFILSDQAGNYSIRQKIKIQKDALQSGIISSTAEYGYEKLKQKNPNLTDEDLLKIFKKEYGGKLHSISNLSEDITNLQINSGIQNAKKAIDKKEFLDPTFINSLIEGYSQLEKLSETIDTGRLDPNNINTLNFIDNNLDSATTLISKISSAPHNQIILDDIDILQKLNDEGLKLKVFSPIQNAKDIIEKSKLSLTQEISEEWNNGWSSYLPNVITIKAIIGASKWWSYEVSSIIDRRPGESRREWRRRKDKEEQDKEIKKREEEEKAFEAKKYSTYNVIPNALGNIIFPNKTDVNKTIPLNTAGAEFIRKKIKEINFDQNKQKETPQSSIITIIEQKYEYQESYELYTMNQFSKGILRT